MHAAEKDLGFKAHRYLPAVVGEPDSTFVDFAWLLSAVQARDDGSYPQCAVGLVCGHDAFAGLRDEREYESRFAIENPKGSGLTWAQSNRAGQKSDGDRIVVAIARGGQGVRDLVDDSRTHEASAFMAPFRL